jgi:hypothetical protein
MTPEFLVRKDAAQYLKEKYGFGSKRSLDKLATVGGGPEYRKAGCLTLYTPEALDRFALSRIGPPQTSTAQNKPTRAPIRPRGRPRKYPAAAAPRLGSL